MSIDDCGYEERAAIMQYLGGLSKELAEQKAHRICYLKTETRKTRDGGTEFRHTLSAPASMKQAAANQVAKQEEEQVALSFEDFRAMARHRGW